MILESVLIMGLAIILDLKFGDPKSSRHPTVWIGSMIAKMTLLAKNRNPVLEKMGGMIVLVAVSVPVVSVVWMLMFVSGIIPLEVGIVTILVGAVLFKTTFAIRGMEKHAISVLECLNAGDMNLARGRLAMIVKRNTANLDEEHVVSAVIESVGENTVDGITGPMFYYAAFGVPGAFLYRIVNTADSMIGYRSRMFRNVGWFAAVSDTVLNYIPARLTGYVMVLATAVLHGDWKESYRVMRRDGGRTDSVNSGYPMAALAGALGIRFEKIDHYVIGRGGQKPSRRHIIAAIALMKITSVLFFLAMVYLMALAYLITGWIHA